MLGYNRPHLFKNFPYNNTRGNQDVHNIQETSIVNDIVINIAKINASLDYQNLCSKLKVKSWKKLISILIDLGSSQSYVSASIVEM